MGQKERGIQQRCMNVCELVIVTSGVKLFEYIFVKFKLSVFLCSCDGPVRRIWCQMTVKYVMDVLKVHRLTDRRVNVFERVRESERVTAVQSVAHSSTKKQQCQTQS